MSIPKEKTDKQIIQ